MASIVRRLYKKDLIHPPPWLVDNLMFEGVIGSKAYGCEDPNDSDEDIVGMAMPPKNMIFPHLDGHILGFGKKPPSFENFQQHHIHFGETKRDYDVSVYGIVKMFQLCRDNNPNMIELLYLPKHCVYHSSLVYEHMRAHRSMFLHRGCYEKFRGYASSQLSKLDKPGTKRSPKRQATVEKYGYDTKFAYHIVRLMLECEQIYKEGTLRLNSNRNIYKAIRNGEWPKEKFNRWFDEKESSMERLYNASPEEVSLPEYPDEEAIKQVLIECLEMHYGNLTAAVSRPDEVGRIVSELEQVIHRYR